MVLTASSVDPGAASGPGSGSRVERLPELDGVPPVEVAECLRDLPGLVLLESARPGRRSDWSLLAADPLEVLDGPSPGPDPFAAARGLLARLDPTAPAAGTPPFIGGLAGFLGYDLGRSFEPRSILASDDQGLPPMRLGLYDWALAWDRRTGQAYLGGRRLAGDEGRLDERLADVRARVGRQARQPSEGAAAGSPAQDELIFETSLDQAAFEAGVERIRSFIAAGEIYQANLARRLAAPFKGDPWSLYRAVRTGDPALFAAYLDLGVGGPARGAEPLGAGARAIVSASPEAFLSIDAQGVVSTDPIKGTRPRGATPEADRALAAELLASDKDRAENVMIVDVLRNDLGRVCLPGSVRTPRLCRLERTTAVQHLVSTVTGRLGPGRDAFDLLAAAFPGGSITGAPKIRAMEILEELEPVRRGPYTGTALWLGPDGRLGSSILIRTFVADGRRLTLHIGGGITWRSNPTEEWFETVAKAAGPLRAIDGREAAGA
jgi:para-aminobenzoate synthetase component I